MHVTEMKEGKIKGRRILGSCNDLNHLNATFKTIGKLVTSIVSNSPMILLYFLKFYFIV